MHESRAASSPVASIVDAELQEKMYQRAVGYVEVLERATSRMLQADYRSADFIDDWFSLWGKAVRDSWAMAAVAWKRLDSPLARLSTDEVGDDG